MELDEKITCFELSDGKEIARAHTQLIRINKTKLLTTLVHSSYRAGCSLFLLVEA